MHRDEVISSLGANEKEQFDLSAKKVMSELDEDMRAISKTKEDFEKIEDALQDVKDKAIEQNTKRLEDETAVAKSQKED